VSLPMPFTFFPGGPCHVCGGDCTAEVDVLVQDATDDLWGDRGPMVWQHRDKAVCQERLS
jgi:hypothetical protein